MNMFAKPPKHPIMIAGSGGGGGKRGGRGGGGGTEAPNSLKSHQLARIIDLLGEGPIEGPVDGAQSIYYDGVAVQSSDGQSNFNSWSIAGNSGWPAQPVLPGFASQEAETAVSLIVKVATPLTRTINDENVDRARITVSTPALQVTNKDNGNITGTTITFDVFLQSNGGGYQLVTRHVIDGKTNTRYQRSLSFKLTGDPPFDIRITRVTADSTTVEMQNDLYWDSYTAIIDTKINYTLSAVVGHTIDAEQFQAIPKRVYDVKGLIINVPVNFDPITRLYSGTWIGPGAGGWKAAWTDDPAWILYDIVTQNRYGVGDFIKPADVDPWALYNISKWCAGKVDNGKGGTEFRWTCNVVINTQQEAFDLINSMASVFRGNVYWGGGQMVAIADMPADPTALYSNSNVIDGAFDYHGSDIRARHNTARVSWKDPDNLGETRFAIVEDQPSVSKYGIQPVDILAIGCTSESQAIRVGKWTLFSETYEGETVNFSTGLNAAYVRPGDVAQVADVWVGGERRGGRIKSATSTVITIDAPVILKTGINYTLAVILPDGTVQSRSVVGAATTSTLTATAAFTQVPLPDSNWVLASSDLQPTLWRTISAKQTETDRYEVTSLRQRTDKWDYIEKGIKLVTPDISNIGVIPPVVGLNARDYLVALSSVSIGVRMLFSWQSTAPSFEIAWRPRNGNWFRARVDQTAHDVEAVEGSYEIWVTPINMLGRRGNTSKINFNVVGRTAPPADVQNFRVQIVDSVAMFQWAPSPDLDVLIGGYFQIRYSPRVAGATWTSSNIVITSIPGTATTVELPYRPGTYFIRSFDITGIPSAQPSVIVASGPDIGYRSYVRISESPTWQGIHNNTLVRQPQQWLILGDTGGFVDDQLALLSTWAEIDLLPVGASGESPGEGSYNFYNQIDMGGIFPVRLTVDMLAFPYVDNAVFFDERPGRVDDWSVWDDAGADGDGMVTIRVRQTNQDPLSATAVWTPWSQFISGQYVGRGFQFQALLATPPGQNVAIEELSIIADISAKVDQGADVPVVAASTIITYGIKFFNTPSVSIAVQNGVSGDRFLLTKATTTGFTLQLYNSAGAAITTGRSFDWIASGY